MGIFGALERMSAAFDNEGGGREWQEDWAGISFQLGPERLLVAQTEVGEVLAPPPSTRVPGAAPWVRGLANLRGAVVLLVDLGHCLMGTPTPAHSRNRYLVVKDGEEHMGLLVDAVLGLRRFSRTHIEAGQESTPALAAFLEGQVADGDTVTPVISLRKVVREGLVDMAEQQRGAS